MLKSFLRTPRGVLALIGATLFGVAGLAAVIAMNREFFEKHVCEKYAVPPERFQELGPQLWIHTQGVKKVKALPVSERLGLYEAWMQTQDAWLTRAPSAMTWADPTLYVQRAHRTLICGSEAQRRKALLFLRLSGHPQAIPLLARARDQALTRHEAALAQAAQEALEALAQELRERPPHQTASNN